MTKERTQHIAKKILFGIIILTLFLPILQKMVGFTELTPLNGDFSNSEPVSFSVESWFDGKYQDKKSTYLKEHVGFRNFFVRFYNQQYFSLYKESRANSVVVGKEDYLYELSYIKAHLGRDFIGDSLIAEKVYKLQRISDTLNALGKHIVIVLTPGKGSYFPEYIPERFQPQLQNRTNYSAYKSSFKNHSVPVIDFHQWFRSMKDTSSYRLFPKTGIHWSIYGQNLAADSMISYISQLTEKQLPFLRVDSIPTTTKMWYGDDDIEKGMNLMYDIEDLEMAYPVYKIDSTNCDENPPKVLTVADSYFWGMFNWGMSRDIFHGGQFWYYNKQIYPDSYEKSITVEEINLQQSIEENDVILLISTDANLHRFAFGFIDATYEVYFGK